MDNIFGKGKRGNKLVRWVLQEAKWKMKVTWIRVEAEDMEVGGGSSEQIWNIFWRQKSMNLSGR